MQIFQWLSFALGVAIGFMYMAQGSFMRRRREAGALAQSMIGFGFAVFMLPMTVYRGVPGVGPMFTYVGGTMMIAGTLIEAWQRHRSRRRRLKQDAVRQDRAPQDRVGQGAV